MNTGFLEHFYETVVLPQYGDAVKDVREWKDHGQAGQDAYVHYFEDSDGTEYVLLNEDFPGSDYMNDDLTHDIVDLPGDSDDSTLHIAIGQNWIPNVSGYFTLYKERRSR